LIKLWPKCDIPTFDAAYQALMSLSETKPQAYWHMCLIVADIYRDDCRAANQISTIENQTPTSNNALFYWAIRQYESRAFASATSSIRQFDMFMKSNKPPTLINDRDWHPDAVRVLLGMIWFVTIAQ
jgi:hypothetical protein